MISEKSYSYDFKENDVHFSSKDVAVETIWFVGEIPGIPKDELQSSGFEVIQCSNIHQANKFLFSNSSGVTPSAICCYIDIPQRALIHLTRTLSSNEKYCTVPFILVAKGSEDLLENKVSNIDGVDDIVSFDISVSDLIKKIEIIRKFKTYKKTLPYRMPDEEKVKTDIQSFLRRIFDILLSAIFIMLLSPLILLICILIKLESKGPVFYVSLRAGKDYKIFKFYKFRTMFPDADKKVQELRTLNQYDMLEEDSAMFFKIKEDPRVTTIGRFLRNTSLDELPQLINVFIGDMSMVGNRPLPLYEACTLTTDEAARRFLAPAGITGLWQVEKRGRPEMSAQERVNLDIDYANNHSFFYDMKILFTTPKGIIQRSDV